MEKYIVIFCLTILFSCSSESNDTEPVVDFDIVLSSDIVPAEVSIVNNTEMATSFIWTFEGGDITSSIEVNPTGIKYNMPGVFTITLEAFNGSNQKTLSKEFKLYLTDEILTFESIQLGSVGLESSLGVAFSTSSEEVIPSPSYNSMNGNSIDIVYYGSDEHTVYTFTSPDNIEVLGLTPIPNALPSRFIYERANDSPNYFTAEEFDAMQDDRLFRELDISRSSGSLTEGISGEVALPFIAVYKNALGKIGLIKVTELTKGPSGKITFDIKRQK